MATALSTSDPQQLLAVVGGTAALYGAVLVLVRVAGRRTLAQISAYDALVTIALGSVVATAALPARASVIDAVVVIVTLLVLQTLLGWLRQRFPLVQRLTDFAPMPILRSGQSHLSTSPWSAQLTVDELASRLRQQGITDLSAVDLVVLEPDGKLSTFLKRP